MYEVETTSTAARVVNATTRAPLPAWLESHAPKPVKDALAKLVKAQETGRKLHAEKVEAGKAKLAARTSTERTEAEARVEAAELKIADNVKASRPLAQAVVQALAAAGPDLRRHAARAALAAQADAQEAAEKLLAALEAREQAAGLSGAPFQRDSHRDARGKFIRHWMTDPQIASRWDESALRDKVRMFPTAALSRVAGDEKGGK